GLDCPALSDWVGGLLALAVCRSARAGHTLESASAASVFDGRGLRPGTAAVLVDALAQQPGRPAAAKDRVCHTGLHCGRWAGLLSDLLCWADTTRLVGCAVKYQGHGIGALADHHQPDCRRVRAGLVLDRGDAGAMDRADRAGPACQADRAGDADGRGG